MIGEQINAIINKNISNLQTKMLHDAPRDTDRLEALMKAKKGKVAAGNMHRRYIDVDYIEMLKVALHLVSGK
jgi:uncharacterized protein (UPF0216 family)